ncbi:MAG: hypothetical protein FD174_4112 [Geobacteraceae bacterium]|nr:MAG: hypothetical protein FD174_4112 [Geobacteraceae bacterium]
MQLSATCALELCWECGEEEDRQNLTDLAKRLMHPSDGDFFEVLDRSIGIIRSAGWNGCIPTWYDLPVILDLPKEQKALRQVICDLNKERNNRPAHGVVAYDSILSTLQWLPDVSWRLINELKELLPIKLDSLVLKSCLGDLTIKSIKIDKGTAIVVRKYSKGGSSWRAQYQVLDPVTSHEGYFDVDDNAPLIAALHQSNTALKSSTIFVGDKIWNPSHLIPFKQTDTFEGRNKEISELIEWWNDKDSRTCIVFGDGGIGKTTLVLEFLNDLLDSSFGGIEWFPQLMFFYSAKQTRWGVNGLEYLSGVVPSIAESVRSLISILDDSLGRDWMKEDPRPLIDKASTFLSEIGLSRNEILIVLDNTETLARTQAQVDDLAKVLRQIAIKLGRVIITSRRREKIEAFPVQVPKLEDKTGAVLLKRLGGVYGAQSLSSAGDSTLTRVSKQLSGKPLLLDVLARHISNSGCGIEQGVQAVLKQGRSDLGEFLFEDAWSRMLSTHKEVFLVLGQVGGAIANQMAAWSCAEMGVQLDDWLESFGETKFGTLNDYGANFDINLNPDAREYLTKKYSEIAEKERVRIDSTVKKIRIKHQQLLRAEISEVTDRVSFAFRTSAAKAAKIAAQRGQVDEAIMWYEEAATADPGNYALLDRFAWYLMNHKLLDRAFGIAKRACQAGPADADAHFTAGMIAARLANIREADKYLDLANKFGKELHLCMLQKARAKLKYAIANGIEKNIIVLNEALDQLEEAKSSSNHNYTYKKHLDERKRIIDNINALISKFKVAKKVKEPIIIRKTKNEL